MKLKQVKHKGLRLKYGFIGFMLSAFLSSTALNAQRIEFDGQIQLQANQGLQENSSLFWGGRYLPEFNFESAQDSLQSWSIQVAANASAFKSLNSTAQINTDLAPYRAWIRYLNKEWEFRLGLQKIDFGAASLLRPLQWFNQIDPRDPLALTNGVYGLLIRYYFKNNTNLWLWSLYGNQKPRGFDLFNSSKTKTEWGGRFQFLVPKGEWGLTYHYRTTDFTENNLIDYFGESPEYRLGLDAKWDLGIGLWTESTYIQRTQSIGLFKHQFLSTLGADYTFGIGNGLHLIGEHLISSFGAEHAFENQASHVSAINANYPLGLFNSISFLVYHQWSTNQNSLVLNYQEQFNKISAYLIAYYNSNQFEAAQQNEILYTFSGPGLQLLLIYNH
ncbi:MAG: hypothetical protein ACPGAO_08365 [Flavobacteriaceae bacterium]